MAGANQFVCVQKITNLMSLLCVTVLWYNRVSN